MSLKNDNKLQLESEKSLFNLNCINSSEFPLTDENFNQNQIKQILKWNINARIERKRISEASTEIKKITIVRQMLGNIIINNVYYK